MTFNGSILIGARDMRRDTVFRAVEAASAIETVGDSLIEPAMRETGLPLDHADPAHLLVSGTGLTHLGSAEGRDKMHKGAAAGDVHVHFFGTATLSFSDGVATQDADVFEIEADAFTLPLRNPLVRENASSPIKVRVL